MSTLGREAVAEPKNENDGRFHKGFMTIYEFDEGSKYS
jgi:hypothetical protein